MKNLLFPLVLFGIMFTAVSCNKDKSDEDPQTCDCGDNTYSPTDNEKSLINSSNTFGFNLFKEVNEDELSDKNIFVSPLSVTLALAMTYNGAQGDTKTAMEDAMSLNGLTTDQINQSYKTLSDALVGIDQCVTLTIANSIWYDHMITVEQDFINTNGTYYDAVVSDLDFSDPASVDTINNWVADNTNQKIEEIIESIDPSTVMYLINAIYFKGTWHTEFDPNESYPGTFYNADGSSKTVTMMKQDTSIGYYSDSEVEIAEIPYGNKNYSMIVAVPAGSLTPDDIIASLDDTKWDTWMSEIFYTEMPLHLPKFKFEYEKKLNDMLIALGMGIAFNGSADFSGITNTFDIYIDEVKHKTFVEVNEEGTEAAAVTSVSMNYESAAPEFYANKPFVFAIKEKNSNAIIFIGKMMDPVY